MSILKAFESLKQCHRIPFFFKINVCGLTLLLQASKMSSNIDEMYQQTENRVQLEESSLSVSFLVSLTGVSESHGCHIAQYGQTDTPYMTLQNTAFL